MKHKKVITLIIIFSILVKALFLFVSGSYLKPQTFESEECAKNLLEKGEFYYINFNIRYYAGISPGYPILCYIVYKILGHNTLWIVILQIVVTSLLVIPVYFVCRRIFNEQTSLFACILCALQPQLIIYSTTKLHPFNVYSLFFSLLILSFLRLRRSLSFRNIFLVGTIIGLAFLFRETSLVIAFFSILWFYVVSHFENKKKFQAVTVIILTSFIIVLPWGIRNYFVFGKSLFLQTNKWQSLWYGNIPGSSGSLYTAGGIPLFEREKADLKQEFFAMSEIEQDKYLKQLTMNYLKEDPIGFAVRILKKIYYFWYFSPYQGSQYPELWMKLYKIYYLIIIFPAIFSMIYSLIIHKNAERTNALLILLLFLVVTGVQSLYFVEGRHRWSIESLLLIFTANGFIIFKDYFSRILKRNINTQLDV